MCVWVQRFLVSDEQNDHTQGLRIQGLKKSPGRRSGSDSGGEKLRPVEAWKLGLIRLLPPPCLLPPTPFHPLSPAPGPANRTTYQYHLSV